MGEETTCNACGHVFYEETPAGRCPHEERHPNPVRHKSATTIGLHIAPISLRAANAWVVENHRHHGPTRGHKFSVSVVDADGAIHGVGIAGRPLARKLDDGSSLEVLRVCTDGTPNACSMLYGAIARAAVQMGYPRHRIFTYVLAEESGRSLHAAGWVRDRESAGGSWSRPSRAAVDKHPLGPKVRWRAAPDLPATPKESHR